MLARQSLTPAEIRAAAELAEVCNAYEGLDLVLDLDVLPALAEQTRALLYYADDALVGFLRLYGFGRNEVEVVGMVHPAWRRRGIFRTLLEAALAEARRRGAARLLLACEERSASGQAFVKAMGAVYSFSEHKMVWHGGLPPAPPSAPLTLRPATAADADLLVQLYVACFDDPEEEMQVHVDTILSDPERNVQLAYLGGAPIGMITLVLSEDEAYIAGFGVVPELRGRGYGRQILGMVINQALLSRTRIVLEVETDNLSALGLYQSCGFRETTAYDYYALDLPTS